MAESTICICPDHCNAYASGGEQGYHEDACDTWCENQVHCEWCSDNDVRATHRAPASSGFTYACDSCRERIESDFKWETFAE